MGAMITTFRLLDFVDEKDILDNYRLQFERHASIMGWQRDTWAVLASKALDVYSGLSSLGIVTAAEGSFTKLKFY